MKKPGEPLYPDDEIPEPRAQGPRRAVERVEPLRRREEDPHDRRLGHRGRAAAAAHDADARRHAHHHRAQQLARHRLRPLDQSLSRLRARLHLLLRAADARLSRPVARPRFRDQDPVQARRRQAADGRARRAQVSARRDRDGHQHRSLPAGRARAEDHALDPRGAVATSTIPSASSPRSPLVTRDIDILADMAQAQPGRGVPLGHHARPRPRARRWSRAPRRRSAGSRRSSALAEAGVPVGVMAAPMIPALNDHEMEAILEAAPRPARTRAGYVPSCACRSRSRICSTNGCAPTGPTAPSTCCR